MNLNRLKCNVLMRLKGKTFIEKKSLKLFIIYETSISNSFIVHLRSNDEPYLYRMTYNKKQLFDEFIIPEATIKELLESE